jgi:hypothetical protein
VTPAHDAAVQVEFDLPLKGRKPLVFSVPRYHYLDREALDAHEAWMASEDGTKYAYGTVEREAAGTRALLGIVLPRHAEVWAKLTDGELLDISQHWAAESRMSLPESAASVEP